MSTYTPVRDWLDPLRSLALGASMASVFLVPSTGYITIQVDQLLVQKKVDLLTTIPDGAFIPERAFDLRTIHFPTRSGLGTPFSPTPMKPSEDKIESDNIPHVLRDISGLPVETLASLAKVSRNAYYKWLDGRGVTDEHITRLTELLNTFHTLHSLCGSGLKEFLETAGPAGRPIDLLISGNSSAVIGLALRPVSMPIDSPSVSQAARQVSGLSGWLRPTAKLRWGAPHLTNLERDEALNRFSPRSLVNEEELHNGIDEDDEAFIAWGFFLE